MTPTTPVETKYTKFSCPNPECFLFNQPGRGNIVHRSWTGRDKGIERLRCTRCQKEFSEREGTLMARAKLPEEKVIRLTKCQRWGVCDEGTADICEVDIKTVHRFQGVSSGRAQEHQQQMAYGLEVEGVQVDEAHSKRRPKKVEWIHTALAMGSLFILWVAFGPRNTDTAAYLIAQVIARLKEVPLFLTDLPGLPDGTCLQQAEAGGRQADGRPILPPCCRCWGRCIVLVAKARWAGFPSLV